MIKEPNLMPLSEDRELIERILLNKYVFLGDYNTLRFNLNGNCSVAEMPVGLYKQFGRIAFKRKFPFSRVFDRA